MTSANSRHQAAYQTILNLLLSHRLKPGQIITQKELIDLVGMTLSPIRLALARLETEGFVTILPQHGVKLVEPSLDLFKNLLQIRITIEKEAWARFAMSAPVEKFDEMIAIHEGFAKEVEGQLTPEILDKVSLYDKNMHTMVVESMGNNRLTEMFRVLNHTIYFLRDDKGNLRPTTIRNVVTVHLEILYLAKERDLQRLADVVERHILNATRVLLAV